MDDFLQLIYKVPFLDSFGITEDALGVKVGLFDTLGMDDRLTLAQALVSHIDTIGLTEGALGVSVALFETLGADDRLSFVDLLTTYADSFGMDDRLTFADVLAVYADTVGITDQTSFVDLFTTQLETFGMADHFLGVNTTLFDTVRTVDDPSKVTLVQTNEETGPWYFDLVGTPASLLSTADSSFLSITGDIDVAVAMIETDWSPTGFGPFVAKWGAAGQRSWVLEFDGSGTGQVVLVWTTAGTTVVSATVASDAAVGFTDGTIGALRATLDVADGANKTVNYYKLTGLTMQDIAKGALLRPLSEWTQVGTTQTESGTTSIFDSTSPVTFGSLNDGAAVFAHKVLGCVIRNGIEGSLELDYRAADATGPYTDVTERAHSAAVTVSSPANFGVESRYGPVFGHNDLLTLARINNWTCGRSGTPDSDPTGDGWIDQAAATTNHGNETPIIAKGKSTLASDERRAFIKFQMSRYVNLRSVITGPGQLGFTFRCTNPNALLAVDLTLDCRRITGSPFTESTLTWNVPAAGGPVTGTLIASLTQNIPANTTQDVTFAISGSNIDNLFNAGNDWLYFRFTTPNAVTPLQVTIDSREFGTVADRPTYNIDLRR